MFDSLSTTEKFLSVTYTQYDNLSYISLFEITHTRNLNTKLSNHLLQILKYMHSESCLLSKHNIWECKLVWVPAYYTHWFLPSAYQLAWVLYLKSSRFDPRYVVYDNCRHSMCVYLFLFPCCFSLRQNRVPGGSLKSAEEWFPFIICCQFQQRLSGGSNEWG